MIIIHRDNWQIQGNLSFDTVGALIAQTQKTWQSPELKTMLTINLSQVHQVDSSGLALLLLWQRLAKTKKIQLNYQSPPLQLITLSEFYQLRSLLRFEEI